MIKSYKDLEVFQLSFQLAMEIFEVTRNFPKEEMYALTSQIIRSSRSISANITEGWAKRKYENEFKRHLIYSLGSAAETETWIMFGLECNYVSKEEAEELMEKVNIIGKMLTKLHRNWKS
ncbi:MAG: four helix bundle protein [Balneolaceae bacterium]